jgi:hypothetical protein
LPTIRDSNRSRDASLTLGRSISIGPDVVAIFCGRSYPVAMRDRRLRPLVAGAAEELAQLVLERLLDDQPGAQPTDLLDRITKLARTSDQRVELMAQPLARDYSRTHLGVPPASS